MIRLQTEISAEQNKKDEGKEFDILIGRIGHHNVRAREAAPAAAGGGRGDVPPQ